MHAVITQKMCVGLDRTQIIDGNHFDICATRFHNRAQYISPDPSKTIYRNCNSHSVSLYVYGEVSANIHYLRELSTVFSQF